jgi:hypothetical protein
MKGRVFDKGTSAIAAKVLLAAGLGLPPARRENNVPFPY